MDSTKDKSAFFKALGLADTQARSIAYRERVAVQCSCGSTGEVVYGNLLTAYKKNKLSWACRACTNLRISEKAKERLAKNNPWKGRKHSEATKEKIKQTRPAAAAKSRQTRKPMSHSERERLREWMRSPSFVEAKKNAVIDREKTKQTNIERYGVSSFSKTEEFKNKISGNNHHKRKSQALLRLPTGEALVDMCQAAGKNPSNGVRIYRRFGESAFREWLTSENKRTGLEILGEKYFGAFLNKKVHDLLPYRPDFQVGSLYVNLDGLYYHSKYPPEYHLQMRERYEQLGLRIMQFREDEMVYAPDIVTSIVNGQAGKHLDKVFARKCTITSLTSKEMCDFLTKNHLMGNHAAARGYGLKLGDELICVISVRAIPDGIEIARFGSKLNTRVPGGFSKLLAHVEKLYQPQKIVSFCDLRYGTGEVYKKAGFELERITLGWCWTDGKQTFNRLQCRANMDDRRLTMHQHADELGWYQLYDAGQAKYVKVKPQ